MNSFGIYMRLHTIKIDGQGRIIKKSNILAMCKSLYIIDFKRYVNLIKGSQERSICCRIIYRWTIWKVEFSIGFSQQNRVILASI